MLERRNLVLDAALASGARPTVVKTRVMCRSQQLCRLDREAAPEAYALPEAWVRRGLPERIAAADAVILSDYAKGVVTSGLIRQVQALAGPDKLVVASTQAAPGCVQGSADSRPPQRGAVLAAVRGAARTRLPPEESAAAHAPHATRLL